MMTSSKKSHDLGYHFDFFRGTYGAWTSTSPENWGGTPPLPPRSDAADPNSEVEIGLI